MTLANLNIDRWLVTKAVIYAIAFFCLLICTALLRSAWLKHAEARVCKQKVKEARAWRQITQRLRQDNQHLQSRVANLTRSAPVDDSQANILGFVQSAVQECGLSLQQLQPLEPVANDDLQERSLELNLLGRYHQLGRLIYILEASHHIVQVRSLDIRTQGLLSQDLIIVLRISFFRMA